MLVQNYFIVIILNLTFYKPLFFTQEALKNKCKNFKHNFSWSQYYIN